MGTFSSEWLEAATREATQRWNVRVDSATVTSWLARFPSQRPAAPERALELVLCIAAAGGESSAVAAFERDFLAPAVARLGGSLARHAHRDEVAQRTRLKLLVEQPPRLATWSAQVPLAAWLRAVVARVATDCAREHDVDLAADETERALEHLPASSDPEFESVRRQHQGLLAQALREALGALPRRERTVLRLHVFQGLGADQVARVFHVDATTVRRWIRGARDTVQAGLRDRLTHKLKLSQSQLDSLVRGIDASLDLSVGALRSLEQ